MTILSQDVIAAAAADLLTDAAMGWELVHQTEQDSKEMLIDENTIIDGFTLAAFWNEVERRPGMGDLLTADEAAELDAYIENDPNYVLFQQSPDKYNVLPQAQREEWVGE